jgi:hypothetical protein
VTRNSPIYFTLLTNPSCFSNTSQYAVNFGYWTGSIRVFLADNSGKLIMISAAVSS